MKKITSNIWNLLHHSCNTLEDSRISMRKSPNIVRKRQLKVIEETNYTFRWMSQKKGRAQAARSSFKPTLSRPVFPRCTAWSLTAASSCFCSSTWASFNDSTSSVRSISNLIYSNSNMHKMVVGMRSGWSRRMTRATSKRASRLDVAWNNHISSYSISMV